MNSKIQVQPFNSKLASVLVSIVIIIYIMHILADIIIPFAFSGILAILLLPLCSRLEKWGVPRILAIIACILVFTVLLGFLFYLTYTQLASFEDILPQLTEKAEALWRNFQLYIRDNFHVTRTKQTIEGRKYLTEFLKNNASFIGNTLSVTTGILMNAVLIPIYVFMLLYYRNFFHLFLHKAFGEVNIVKVNTVLFKIKSIILNYLVGLLTLIFIIGTLNTIGLVVLGIDYAVFFGFLAGFLVLIPYIGITIGSLLPMLMALITKDSYWYAIGVVSVMGGVQFLEANFITPYVVGSKVSINSMASIVALLLFGSLWGISGLILAIPLTAILKVIFDSIEDLKPYGFLIGEMESTKKIKVDK